jgi:hypothetical protein
VSVALGVLKPSKPISAMTVEERRAFGASIVAMLKVRHDAAAKLSPRG